MNSRHATRYSFALERPDYAIANYFMVQRLEEPLRAALDLPSHDLEVRSRRACSVRGCGSQTLCCKLLLTQAALLCAWDPSMYLHIAHVWTWRADDI